MALSRRAKSKLGWVAAAAGPIVAVQAARFMFGGGPVGASAAPPAAASQPTAIPAAAVPQPGPLSEEQLRAIEWLSSRACSEAVSRSPMHRPDAPRPVARIDSPSAEKEVELPPLRLGGIIRRSTGAVASINNRLFSVGDQPVRGWTVERIDHEERRVIFRCDDGRAAELTSAGPRIIEPSTKAPSAGGLDDREGGQP